MKMDFIKGRIENKTYIPRLGTDMLFEAEAGSFSYTGEYDKATRFVESHQVKNTTLWKLFVKQYKIQIDSDNGGWRGEYWGKMMRGACWVYKYTLDSELYSILEDAVRDLMTAQEENGRFSSYKQDKEFTYWDMWCRKYVLLGMQYFYDICEDEGFKNELIETMRRHLDYIIDHVGEGEGKIDILESTTHNPATWGALNSSSILEPVVRFYNITGEKKYLDYAKYLVDRGGSKWGNIYTLAIEGKKAPYEYPVTKAYESMSYFEGVLEYYRASGDENAKTAFLNFMERLSETDITIIGCSGCTHELFDHSFIMQTEPSDLVKQETCVTVTLMKFFARVLSLTDDSLFADVIEKAFYNAYLGALNINHCESDYPRRANPDKDIKSVDLPFDSYSPLIAGRRGRMIGGYQVLSDNSYYGCCACIGAAGLGVYMKSAVILDNDTLTVNFYEEGIYSFDYKGKAISLKIKTDYPKDGRIFINIKAEEPTEITLRLRVPEWADAPKGYRSYKRFFSDDTIEINFDMPIKIHYPECMKEDTVYTDMSKMIGRYYSASAKKVYSGKEDENYFAVTRGPLTLAADSRTGKSADSPFFVPENGTLCESDICEGVPCLVKMKFEKEGKEPFYLVDYQSAGRDWQTLIAAWLLRDDK